MERISIVNYSNAFFGAFFGFWCKSMLDPFINKSPSDWLSAGVETIIILFAVSLHMIGLWKSKRTNRITPVERAFLDYKYNWSSLIVFIVGMFLYGYFVDVLLHCAGFGIMLYAWWVVGTFVALILTEPEKAISTEKKGKAIKTKKKKTTIAPTKDIEE